MTVPVALLEATVAVSRTDVPTVAAVSEEVKVVVVAVATAAVMVMVNAAEVLVSYEVFPLKVAVMLCVPAANVVVASVATPVATVPVPNEVVPS